MTQNQLDLFLNDRESMVFEPGFRSQTLETVRGPVSGLRIHVGLEAPRLPLGANASRGRRKKKKEIREAKESGKIGNISTVAPPAVIRRSMFQVGVAIC